ncbi:MAG: exodeoxyribonuclease VII large subunit [Kiritimatiellae bacterium]|nr:exodeoxyribonuclease VII large subunit [Kiritimatiellia bacterium]
MEIGRSEESAYSVSGLTMTMKGVLEKSFTKVFVTGEVSGFKVYPSGHAYFTLKDDGAQISAVMFKSSFDKCKVKARLKDGVKVCLYATASLYPQRGSCQLMVFAAKLVGDGDLMQRFLELKARLEAEGLFDVQRKKPLPFLPRRIGIITSPAGAVVHDMCRVLNRRFPGVGVRVFPASVQGEEAPASLLSGVRYFNSPCPDAFKADLIIIARGGGSFEDLFCFNDESLVRAIASSHIPIISAVGHETDFTLCDFAADKRAGTPSIAAEMAVPERRELERRLAAFLSSVTASLRSKYQCQAQRVDHLSDILPNALSLRGNALQKRMDSCSASLQVLAEGMRSKCRVANSAVDAMSDRLLAAFKLSYERKIARLDSLSSKLSVLSPYSVLERGYSLTTDSSGNVLKDAESLREGDEILTRFARGTAKSSVCALR